MITTIPIINKQISSHHGYCRTTSHSSSFFSFFLSHTGSLFLTNLLHLALSFTSSAFKSSVSCRSRSYLSIPKTASGAIIQSLNLRRRTDLSRASVNVHRLGSRRAVSKRRGFIYIDLSHSLLAAVSFLVRDAGLASVAGPCKIDGAGCGTTHERKSTQRGLRLMAAPGLVQRRITSRHNTPSGRYKKHS